LYPGGGFQIDDKTSNFKLKTVLQSPQFRKVIVTQQFTFDYLIKNKFCTSDKINFIFGGVVPQVSLKKDVSQKLSYLINKPTLDICFCAAKYMPKGIDKGYDVFIELAHLLNKKFDFVKFHVIGGFDKNDIDVSNLNNNIKFYGYQNFDNLNKIFKIIDIIVSPNKPFYLDKGAFDGFPLGTVVEAVLNGVVALLSDQLNQNNVFDNYKEIVIIESNTNKIEIEILNLINNPEKLYNLSENGRLKFVEVYSNQVQMKPRIELLENEIIKSK
jgi:glycosyltransferase involved in cell wall biosynthesis